jgi:hypothetical protein
MESSDQTQAISVTGTPRVRVITTSVDVRVEPGTAGRVIVKKQAHVAGQRDAEAALARLLVQIAQSDAEIVIRAELAPAPPTFMNWGSLRLVLQVPADLPLVVETRSGDSDVTGITAPVQISMTSGDVTLHQVTGQVQIDGTSGDVRLDAVRLAGKSIITLRSGDVGGEVDLAADAALAVETTSGDIRLSIPKATPARLETRARSGDISVRGWPAEATQRVKPNSVVGAFVPTPTVVILLSANSGDITLRAR